MRFPVPWAQGSLVSVCIGTTKHRRVNSVGSHYGNTTHSSKASRLLTLASFDTSFLSCLPSWAFILARSFSCLPTLVSRTFNLAPTLSHLPSCAILLAHVPPSLSRLPSRAFPLAPSLSRLPSRSFPPASSLLRPRACPTFPLPPSLSRLPSSAFPFPPSLSRHQSHALPLPPYLSRLPSPANPRISEIYLKSLCLVIIINSLVYYIMYLRRSLAYLTNKYIYQQLFSV